MALKLLVCDIDNTLFDWAVYYSRCFKALVKTLSKIIKVSEAKIYEEAKLVFAAHDSVEYPFLVQQLPSVLAYFKEDVEAIIEQAVKPTRRAFSLEAKKCLVPYPPVKETLAFVKSVHPTCPLVALTDAPRYVAMWKLNKLGLLNSFDAVYGLPDPKIPTHEKTNKVLVEQEILIKHLNRSDFGYKGKVRVLPSDYEKPGTKGLKMVLIDYEVDEGKIDKSEVLWVGDNLSKDIVLGKSLGVHTAWAKYGAQVNPTLKKQIIRFSPEDKIRKHIYVDPAAKAVQPDFVLEYFSDLKEVLRHI
ncbi:MAG: HAD family hydrolase [Oligoflexales bacterium]